MVKQQISPRSFGHTTVVKAESISPHGSNFRAYNRRKSHGLLWEEESPPPRQHTKPSYHRELPFLLNSLRRSLDASPTRLNFILVGVAYINRIGEGLKYHTEY
jgi:hypothetical protein